MTRRGRLALFAAAAAVVACLLGLAYAGLPRFGTAHHPYRDRAVAAALHERHTANTVASVTFDQRGIDTLGEEFMLFAAALGAMVLLRPEQGERTRPTGDEGDEEGADGRRVRRPLDAVQVVAYAGLPVTVLVGWYVVAHGHLTPGGGFQGGVIIATAVHLLYVGRNYRALQAMRPMAVFDYAEAVGAGAYAVLGLSAMATGAAFLTNVLPYGELKAFASAGTVPLLNGAVGLEVGSAVVLLLAEFFQQALVIRDREEAS